MKFERLAEYLEKLEGVSSRLAMTELLAQLWKEVDADDAKTVAYLSQGMLGPKYNNPDMGMAEKQAIKAVAYGFDISPERAGEVFKEYGDLGKAVEKLSEEKKASKLTVQEVHELLLKIAQSSGGGSQERKINLLGELLSQLDARSAKYATKMALGKLRSGFSDMTVLDSLSWMMTGNKNLREDIEKIYNVRADLGEVVRLVKSQVSDDHDNDYKTKIAGIKADPVVGTPILVARAERAKSPAEIWERNGISAAEHKLDGLRIQAHVQYDGKSEPVISLFSRGMENVTDMYPDVVQGLSRQVHEECILDGEMIAVGKDGKYLPFQETVQRKRKYDILEMMSEVPLKYYTFDVLTAGGESLLSRPNEERWMRLQKILSGNGDTVRLMPRVIVHNEKEIEEFFYKALGEGTEGIVVKKLDGVYKSGSRDFNWIKYKKSYDESGVADTIDGIVMGYDLGQGKRSGFGIGGFLIGVQKAKTGKFQTIAKIGTGLTDDEWRQMKKMCDEIKTDVKPEEYEVEKILDCDVWVKPKIVVEIKSDEITKSPAHSSGYALRFPRLVTIREMKIEEAATTAEVVRLYELQEAARKSGGKNEALNKNG